MKKKHKKRRIFLVIIILIIIFIAIISIIKSITKIAKKSSEDTNSNSINSTSNIDYKNEYENVIDKTKEDFIEMKQIVPDNYNMFARLYSGEIETKKLYEKIYSLVYEIIPKTYNELKGKNQNEIEEYYNKNTVNIKNDLGIENVEEYIEFVEKAVTIGNNKYVSSLLDVKNFSQEDNYSKIDLNVTYTNLSVLFEISIINNENEEDPTFIINVK